MDEICTDTQAGRDAAARQRQMQPYMQARKSAHEKKISCAHGWACISGSVLGHHPRAPLAAAPCGWEKT